MAKKLGSKTAVRGYKKLQCKYCTNICERVDINADAITCSVCVQRMTEGKVLEPRKK
jgi:hypothetical protein